MEKMQRFAAIKKYFGDVRPVETKELKDLTPDDRTELAIGAAKELGVELESPAV